MKMGGLRSRVFILATLIFLVRTGFSQESNGFWPLSGEFSADLTYVGEGNAERGGKQVSDFDEIDSDIRVVLTPRTKIGILRFGAEWQRYSFGFPDQTALPNTLQSFSTLIGLDVQLSDSIIVRAEGQPGLYDCGLGLLVWDDFNLPFFVVGTYIFSQMCSLFSV